MKKQFLSIAAAAALSLGAAIATPAQAWGTGGWGSGNWTAPNVQGGGAFFSEGVIGGNTAAAAKGFGQTVETYAKVEEEFGLLMSGTIVADPFCVGECGNQTFGAEWFSLQTGQTGALAVDTGHGTANASVGSAFHAEAGAAGVFGFSLPVFKD